jgi:RimJ/RimL family protein N-acetyltransferase
MMLKNMTQALLQQLCQITTPRLIIRPTKKEDAAGLYEAMDVSRRELAQWMPWGARISPEYAQNFAHYCEISWQKQHQNHYPFVIVLRETGTIIGAMGFNEYSQSDKGVFEIGYWISTAWHGKGFATEATLALSHYGFDALSPALLIICVQKGNDISMKIPHKLHYEFQLTRKKACRDCVTSVLDDFNVYACHHKTNLPHVQYDYEYLSEPIKKVDFDFNRFFNTTKTPPGVVMTSDFMILPLRQEDFFHLQGFIKSTPTIQGKYSWSNTAAPVAILKKFVDDMSNSTQFMSQAQDFCQCLYDRTTRFLTGLMIYHVRDRSVPFVTINFFWADSIDAEHCLTQVLGHITALISKMFSQSRIEFIFSSDQMVSERALQAHGFYQEGTIKNYWRHTETMAVFDGQVFVKSTLID